MRVEDLLAAKQSSVSVAYQRFVLLESRYPNSLICFYEGYDNQYYHVRVKHIFSQTYQHIICKGKYNVLLLRGLIQKNYRKAKTALFIDRDFDKPLKGKYRNVYETPCYSIENLYCLQEAFEEILKCEFNILVESREYENCIQLYQKLSNEFLSSTLLFNAWYYTIKEKSHKLKVPTNVCLDMKLPKGFCKIHLTHVEVNYDFPKILLTFPEAISVTIEEVEKNVEFLGKHNLHLHLRGKYFLYNFFIPFIKLLIDDANTTSKKQYLTSKVSLNINEGLALTNLSQYAQTPTCLQSFISKFNTV